MSKKRNIGKSLTAILIGIAIWKAVPKQPSVFLIELFNINRNAAEVTEFDVYEVFSKMGMQFDERYSNSGISINTLDYEKVHSYSLYFGTYIFVFKSDGTTDIVEDLPEYVQGEIVIKNNLTLPELEDFLENVELPPLDRVFATSSFLVELTESKSAQFNITRSSSPLSDTNIIFSADVEIVIFNAEGGPIDEITGIQMYGSEGILEILNNLERNNLITDEDVEIVDKNLYDFFQFSPAYDREIPYEYRNPGPFDPA